MQIGPFFYSVQVEVTLTGRELLILYQNALSHYDARCRAAGRVAKYPGEPAAEVYGLIQKFIWDKAPANEGESSHDHFMRVLQAKIDEVVVKDEPLPSRTLDLFAKITEQPAARREDEETRTALWWTLRRALKSISTEHERVNARTSAAR